MKIAQKLIESLLFLEDEEPDILKRHGINLSDYKTNLHPDVLKTLFIGANRPDKKWEKTIVAGHHEQLKNSIPMEFGRNAGAGKLGDCSKNAYKHGKEHGLNLVKGHILISNNDESMKHEGKTIHPLRAVHHVWNVDKDNKVVEPTDIGNPHHVEYRAVGKPLDINHVKSHEEVADWFSSGKEE